MTEQRINGWIKQPKSRGLRRTHYYIDDFSLCQHWGYYPYWSGPREYVDDPPDACRACKREVARMSETRERGRRP